MSEYKLKLLNLKKELIINKGNYDYNKQLKEKNILVKEATFFKNYSKELRNILTIIYSAFSCYYDKKFDELFYHKLKSLNIYFKDSTTKQVMIDNNIKSILSEKQLMGNTIYGSFEKAFKNKKNAKTCIYVGKQLNGENHPLIEVLTTFIHELRHGLTECKDNIESTENYIKMQTGIREIVKNNYNNDLYVNNAIIDELFTEIYTELLATLILNYSRYYIKNESINKILNDFLKSNKSYNYMTPINSYAQNICAPLLDKNFLLAIDLTSYDSNFDHINEYFDDLFNNEYLFRDFSSDLEEAVMIKHKQRYYYDKHNELDKNNFYLNIIKEKIKKIK